MKLRYYMRGLGIGILVTAILMGVTLDGKTEKLTDAEIIERAEALGMEQKYETTVLADAVSENEAGEKETDDDTKEPEKESVTEETEDVQPEEILTDIPEEDVSEEDASEEVSEEEISEEEEEQVPKQEVGETVQITVQGGDGSQTVARKLAEAGLVEDAQAYDKYLCRNGYDKRICTGTHTIPVGAGDEEIAKIITSRSR